MPLFLLCWVFGACRWIGTSLGDTEPSSLVGVARTRWENPTCLSRSVVSASPSAVLLLVLPSPLMLSLTNWKGSNQVPALFLHERVRTASFFLV